MKIRKRWITVLLAAMLFSACTTAQDKGPESRTDTASVRTEPKKEKPEQETHLSPMPEVATAVTAEPTAEPTPEETPAPESTPQPASGPAEEPTPEPTPGFPAEPQAVGLNPDWEFADYSEIHTGTAMLYRAQKNRKDLVIGVNAGHGTAGGESALTYCHPDKTPKVTGGSTAEGLFVATAVSSGMTFLDGTPEKEVTLQEAQILKELLLEAGFDVLMLRDGEDVQLDNVARTVICNNVADCHVSLHWDGDGLNYDKGFFYMSVPDALKEMYPVSGIWQEDNRLGDCLVAGLSAQGFLPFEGGSMQMDLTQTSYSSVPSVDIELGNAASVHDEETLRRMAEGLAAGIASFFE